MEKKNISSTMRRSSARTSIGEESCKRIVRRIASLPRNILEGCSRVMNQGIDLIRIGGRTNHHHHHHHHNHQHHNQQPLNFPFQNHPSNFHPQEEWSFLTNFEQQYGTTHPFFYACRFKDVMKIARDEHKFIFMYVHSSEHPFTSSFCRETLCSEVVVQFLDSNFVCWGGLSNGGEGFQMATALNACTFPFCAVVAAPASGDNIAVLQQIEGPVSPAELVEILQRTIEEQGVAFGSDEAKHDETRRANQRLREEQDVAYVTSLQIDQEKETLQKKPISVETSHKAAEATQILIRFPNGERRECCFLCTDNIRAIYVYINSLGLTGGGNYRLISNFPRKVYGEDEMGMSLRDCGLHPKASLFLELI